MTFDFSVFGKTLIVEGLRLAFTYAIFRNIDRIVRAMPRRDEIAFSLAVFFAVALPLAVVSAVVLGLGLSQ